MLPRGKRQELKLLDCPHTLIHLISWRDDEQRVLKRGKEQKHNVLTRDILHMLCLKLLPVSPAPAAPNREAMIAMPVAEPRAAAPPAPSTALAPAATSGAASPPVTPGEMKNTACHLFSDHMLFYNFTSTAVITDDSSSAHSGESNKEIAP